MKQENSNTTWADLLINKGYNAGFKDDDLSDLMDLKEEHDRSFILWCKQNYYAGSDDQLDNDLMWIGKAINFFIEREYIKNI